MGSMLSFRITMILFLACLCLELQPAKVGTWIKAGYWDSRFDVPISDVNTHLYTHLIYAFANLNSSSYELSVSSSDNQSLSAFTNTVKQKNPSITTLLSIYDGSAHYSGMVSNSSRRKSFIDSSIKMARVYGFQGLEFCWRSANASENMADMGILFEEWRAAASLEARKSVQSEMILTAVVPYSPMLYSGSFPIDSIRRNLNWVHVWAFDFRMPKWNNFTAAHAALYDPNSDVSADFGIQEWIGGGLPANMLVLGLPFWGYAWTLANPNNSGVGAPATGPGITPNGSLSYKQIKYYVRRYGAKIFYNSTYVVNYCIVGSSWIGFDDVGVVRIKVSYAKERGLRGYVAWEVGEDGNWIFSQAAMLSAQAEGGKQQKGRLLLIILPTIAVFILLLGVLLCLVRMRMLRAKGKGFLKGSKTTANRGFDSNVPNLIAYGLADIEKATDGFSLQNKLGEGGYGPVYKGVLSNGQVIAVKKLSKASSQGFEEFKNEVMLTAMLQHVNLVKVLGFCVEREEQMLIYEYMPNKSLDYYLFDPLRRFVLDWRKRVEIVEGVTQGLLHLQEYSRLTVVHRDLKASNILLDDDMKPKISDFGLARIFAKDGLEANTDRIVGTLGYAPPEYVEQGVYSTKYDVYSFGVLLLQIICGKRNGCVYGSNENLSLLEYAHETWKAGKGTEIFEPSLDDTLSPCKLVTCLQIALLCVQQNPSDRPSMLEVSSMLKNETAVVKAPKMPAFSRKTDEDGEELPLKISSVDNAAITEVVGR